MTTPSSMPIWTPASRMCGRSIAPRHAAPGASRAGTPPHESAGDPTGRSQMSPAAAQAAGPRGRPLRERRVLAAIGGCQAVAPAIDLLRELAAAGISIRSFLEPDAQRWIAPEAVQAIGGGEVWTDGVALAAQLESVPQLDGDAMVILGATPPLASRLARGIAEGPAAVAALAFKGPVLLTTGAHGGPEWSHPAAVESLKCLRQRGWELIGPGAHLASAAEADAAGRPPVSILMDRLVRVLLQDSPGCPILVTSGPTREPIDPVRYLSNRSSGRMGYAVAQAARDLGHPVTLISGPDEGVALPAGVERIRVETAREMQEALKHRHSAFPILIMAAAVSDYRPRDVSPTKIRRDRERREFHLIANPDILSSLHGERRGKVTVGFAIEGGLDAAALDGARKKLAAKGLTFLVLNDPQRPDSAFGGETTRARILWSTAGGEKPRIEDLPTLSKAELGRRLIEWAVAALAPPPRI
ncbi:MAG: bifunctional phosphopantothenoylcysteine decarboxylase/phosphopantothenate--cysteine ligase CoaBC [Candidatus Eisenbacteria bacterium]|nr:bifunctional phosphopantothenoylcysteine decarboxylase/phosphopantothenate--cysteine ligase CoaBC [Candidatus Eisenbacteria bacterium]